MDELFDKLETTHIVSKLDLTSSFHEILLNPKDMHKTSFHTHDAHFEYQVMLFGLSIPFPHFKPP